MTTTSGTFEKEQQDQTLIITPVTDLRELDYQEIEIGEWNILHLLANSTIKNVVLDLHKTDYCGSTAMSFFVEILEKIRNRNGRMAICGVSDNEREILKATALEGLWPICSSREEALKVVQS